MSLCQLCGSGEDVSLIDDEFVPILLKICEESIALVDHKTMICIECNIFLYQIQVFVRKVNLTMNAMNQELQKEIEVFETHVGNAEHGNKNDDNVKTGKFGSNLEEIFEEEAFYDSEICNETEDLNEIIKQPREINYTAKDSIDDEKNDDERLFTFKCHACDVPEFAKMFQLSAHTRSQHNCLPLVKCFCDKMLSTMRGLQRHRAKHFPNETDFFCTNCRQTFKTKVGLSKHFDKWHGPNRKMFICSQCGRNFCNAKVLSRHEITHELPPEHRRKFRCTECMKCFISNEAVKFHVAKHHEKILSYFCDVCTKGFYTRKSLKSHSESHEPHESIACDLCNGTFKTVKYMEKHRSLHFLPPQSSFLVCDICNKQFRKKSQLRTHMLVHIDVAEHTCIICLRSFKRKNYLKTHMVTHTGEKKYNCMFCYRSFADPGNCRKHKLREHPDEIATYESIHGKKGVSSAIYFGIQS